MVVRMSRFPLSVAPMVDRSDRHFRHFIRLLAPRTLLYTEMITAPAILHGDRERLLGFGEEERPLVLQVAGDEPAELAEALRLAEAYSYDEINLNCGCPSDKVQEAHFGACLMAEPTLVAELVAAMRSATGKPVTVKHRIGLAGLDRYEDMLAFVDACAAAGAARFIVHARIAVLEGLSPKENRTVPPLRPEEVLRLKRERPELAIELNGGITTAEAAIEALRDLDGVMIGRAAYDNPWLLTRIERAITGGEPAGLTRRRVIEALIPYVARWEAEGLPAHRILNHLHGLFAGKRGAGDWRRLLSPPLAAKGGGVALLERALATLPEEALDDPE
jgi:tRNA-dihydrouridine synthase A